MIIFYLLVNILVMILCLRDVLTVFEREKKITIQFPILLLISKYDVIIISPSKAFNFWIKSD